MKRICILVYIAINVFWKTTVFSQVTDFKDIVEKFSMHRSQTLVEKIYVHIDRPSYLTGETMWFKLYCVDGALLEPVDVSKVGYVEVLNDKNEPVLQSKISLNDEGVGAGSFVLPATLKSGQYIFRAYTSWMKNFSAEFYFHEQVSIINPFISLEQTAVIESEELDVQFFPEGGDMVYGLQSKVAFRAVNREGKGIDFSGFIVNTKNDTVATFQSLKYGIGSFYITPEKHNEYRAVVYRTDGNPDTYRLPQPIERGYVLQLRDTEDHMLAMRISTNFSSDLEQDLYLLVHTRNILKLTREVKLDNGRADILLDRDIFGEGVSHITLFNSLKLPVCERLYFNGINDFLQIGIETSSSEYHSREEVEVKLNTKNLAGLSVNADLSVAVYRMDSLNKYEHQDILSYLNITSDLVGNIEDPLFYFGRRNIQKNRAETDNLMLTHGWRRFSWNTIMENNHGVVSRKYIPEMRGHILTGRLFKEKLKTPLSGVTVFISAPQESRFNISRTNKSGEFFYETTYAGTQKIVIQTNEDSLSQEIISPFSDQVSEKFKRWDFDVSRENEDILSTRSIHTQVHNAFYRDYIKSRLPTTRQQAPFFGTPDKEYFLDSYTRFPTMEEVLKEYVPEVAVRRSKGNTRILVMDPVSNSLFKDAPLVLIDGTPVLNFNRFMEINPLNIRVFQVVTKKYFYAGLSFGGVLNYQTYQSDEAGYEIDYGLVTNYEFLNTQREFFSPKYDSDDQLNSTRPDTRALLHWEPYVNSDQNGEAKLSFFTSDITGRYRVVVHGNTGSGLVGSSSYLISIVD